MASPTRLERSVLTWVRLGHEPGRRVCDDRPNQKRAVT